MRLTTLTIISILFLLTACASTPENHLQKPADLNNPKALLVDKLFIPESLPTEIEYVDIFELPNSIRHFLDASIKPLASEEQRYEALRKWIFEFADNYEYDPDTTVPITQIEKVGRINCFSFSNLFVAAARYVDIPAEIQLIYSPPAWEMAGRSWVLAQHINVTGKIRREINIADYRRKYGLPLETGTFIRQTSGRFETTRYVIDLNPRIVVNAYRTEILTDNEISSRYYANVGARALLDKDYPKAYLYIKQALEDNLYSSPAWNNLGVLYSRIDQPELARQSYLLAIQVDPDADSALTNLAALHERLGNEQRAAELGEQLAGRQEKNPYYHYNLGEDLMAAGEYNKATERFRKAIRRKKDEQIFYLALAEAQLTLGEVRKAEKSLKKAKKYAAKANTERYTKLTRQLLSAKQNQSLSQNR